MLNSQRVMVVLAASLAVSAGTFVVAESVLAGDSLSLPPREASVDPADGRLTSSPTDVAKPGYPDSSGAIVEVTYEEIVRWRQDREECLKIAANQDEFGAGLFEQVLYDVKCILPTGDPASAARQVVASMDLHAPDIRLASRPTTVDPDSVGLVEVPNDMWVGNPEIFEAVSDSVAIGAWSISVSGRVAWVDWDMGDGQVVRCEGPGTPYETRFDLDPSPDCGHVYSVQGQYTVSATAHWIVQWSGGGQSGTVVTDRTSTAPVVIGEALAARRI